VGPGQESRHFCALGPVVVTADEIGDPQALRLRTLVDVMQDYLDRR
jgi:2-keto-4-pentenoate hydratase/2-oxohepta-3-ene-1,7-dioic acid hydratase in catechol pathway